MPNENENHWTEHICKMLLVSTRTWAIAASTQLGLERRQKSEFKIHRLQDASKYGHRQNDINHQPSTHPSQHRRYIELSATALNTFLNPPPRVAFESIHRYYSCSGSQIYVTNQPVTSNQSPTISENFSDILHTWSPTKRIPYLLERRAVNILPPPSYFEDQRRRPKTSNPKTRNLPIAMDKNNFLLQ